MPLKTSANHLRQNKGMLTKIVEGGGGGGGGEDVKM